MVLSQTEHWTWEKLKKEVDEGHRRFFAKRGINPNQAEGFLFGKGELKSKKGRISQLSSRPSDRPK